MFPKENPTFSYLQVYKLGCVGFIPCILDKDLNQVILAGTLTGVQGEIRCKILAALSAVK